MSGTVARRERTAAMRRGCAQGAYNGLTPLHDAVWHGHLEASRALVEAGHPLGLRTHAGLTARELATLYGYEELARYLAAAEQAGSPPATANATIDTFEVTT